jgi:hypothetical protein
MRGLMRTLIKCAIAVLMLIASAPAFAQGTLGPFQIPGNPTASQGASKPSNIGSFLLPGSGIAISGTPRPTIACSVFTTGLGGCVPASGGGTVNFLRADGVWASPPNSGGTVTSITCANGTVTITTTGTCPERELLSADRIYYVGTDGNDACNGRTNAGGSSGNCAFATFAHAMLIITGQIDFGGHNVTLQCRASHCVYTTALQITPWVGGGTFTFDGGGGSITAAGATAIQAVIATCPGSITVQNVTVGGGGGIASYLSNAMTVGPGLNFAASTGRQIDAEVGGIIYLFNNYTISGGAQLHFAIFNGGNIVNNTTPIVAMFAGSGNTYAYTSTFAGVTGGALAVCNMTFAGTGTNTITTPNNARYNVSLLGSINTCTGSQTFFPGTGSGSPQGSVSSNGVYL